jgi:hypothetical protein
MADADRLRSLGEAHLYVAVAKADGRVSASERIALSHLSRKSQKRYNILGANRGVEERIGQDIAAILSDQSMARWPAEKHVEEGLEHLRRAARSGAASVELTAHKIEEELFALAHKDGYDMRESRFVRSILSRLEELDRTDGEAGS